MTAPSRGQAAFLLALVFVLARAPLHLATFRLPVSNDDAIPLLMARAVLGGELATTLWNQPYNGALDAWLLAPLVALFGSHHAFRFYEVACAVLLVLVCVRLGERLGSPPAGLAAGILAAFGTPYMALMAATGPTPNFLVPLLVAVPLLWATGPRAGSAPAAAGVGLVAGLAIWDSALALPSLAGVAAGLLASRVPVRPRVLAAALGGLVLGVAPLVVARLTGAQAASTVTNLRPRWLWSDGLADLLHAVRGLFGEQVPLVVDGPERVLLPAMASVALAVSLVAVVALGISRRTLPLLGWAGALAVAFAFSRRTGGDEVRYVYGLVVPVLVLAGLGLVRAWPWRWAAGLLVLGLAGPWALGHWHVARTWSDPAHAARVWQVVPLEPALETLGRADVRSAYASLQFAGRLMLESDGAVVTSQAWNERIPGDPLRFRDEVDLDPRAAWVLSPHLSRGMPRAGGFRSQLAGLGGRWREDQPGDLVVFRQFEPPYDEGRPVPVAQWSLASGSEGPLPAAARDRDAGTAWTSGTGLAAGSAVVADLVVARRLSALVLQVDLDQSPLAVPWIAELDGVTVAEGPRAHGLQWVNGVPRAGRQALLVVPLDDRPGQRVRLVFQGAGPSLVVREAFLYGPDETEVADAGAQASEAALAAARSGRWAEAVEGYREAVRLSPDRASHHAAVARAQWRAARRQRWDVESLPDGGEDLVRRR